MILLQPENEYTVADNYPLFPDSEYFQYVEDQYRNNSIVVPLISNDASPKGYFAPGPPQLYKAKVDIYGESNADDSRGRRLMCAVRSRRIPPRLRLCEPLHLARQCSTDELWHASSESELQHAVFDCGVPGWCV